MKSSGCTFIDGVLYWVVARHEYGETSGDPYRRQPAHNASIIKRHRLWSDVDASPTECELSGADVSQDGVSRPPYFIEFGREGSGNANVGDYVYALSNNGLWDCGDDMVAGPGGAIEDQSAERLRLGVLHGRERRRSKCLDEEYERRQTCSGRRAQIWHGRRCLPACTQKIFHDRVVLSRGRRKDERGSDASRRGIFMSRRNHGAHGPA